MEHLLLFAGRPWAELELPGNVSRAYGGVGPYRALPAYSFRLPPEKPVLRRSLLRLVKLPSLGTRPDGSEPLEQMDD